MGQFEVFLSPAVVASLVAALVATLGLVVVALRDGWANNNRVYFVAFAAGVLVTTALMLFPEALEATPNAPLFALGGYMLLYTLNVIARNAHGAVIAPFLAIGLHSFIDGFEYGVLFDYDLKVGLIASVGLIVHEFAEGVILYTVLRLGGVRAVWSFVAAFVGAAVTTPAGAVASQLVLETLSDGVVGALLATATGALLFVGATHLPMQLQRGNAVWAMPIYALGAALALGLSFAHFHGADGDGHDHAPKADHDHDHDD